MTKEDQKVIEEVLYPIIKANILPQFDMEHLSVSHGTDPDGEPVIVLTDGRKILDIPIKTPLLVNVSLLVDTIALKRYLLS